MTELQSPNVAQSGDGLPIETSFCIPAQKDMNLHAAVIAGIEAGVVTMDGAANDSTSQQHSSVIVAQFIQYYEQLRQGQLHELTTQAVFSPLHCQQ
jgi:hypothetical protein